MLAEKDHERGDIISHSYGEALTNYDFFTLYGFLWERESALGYKLTVKIDTMPLSQKKLALLSPKYHEQTFTIKMNILEDEIFHMLAFVRYLVFDDEKNFDAYIHMAAEREHLYYYE